MPRIKTILIIAALVLAGMLAWQIGAAEVANMSFQEDMRDMGSQAGSHVGYLVPKSDDELIQAVVDKAKQHGIELKPTQVVVREINPGPMSTRYLAANYTVPVSLGFYSFNLHFSPSSDKTGLW